MSRASIALAAARRAALAALAALAAGCAAPGAERAPVVQMWIPASPDHWRASTGRGVTLYRGDGTVRRHVAGAQIGSLLEAKARVEAAAGTRAELALADLEAPNAFAFSHQGRPMVAFSLGWLDRFGSDADAIAAVIGHELAHLHLGHTGEARARREKEARETGYVAGVVLRLVGVPFGGTLAGNAARAYARSFTRDEERAADALGLRWALAAGYDPCGMRRMARALQALPGDAGLPWLSTHPGHEERAEAAAQAAAQAGRPPCGD